MAKELPYFKFYCSEWSDGDVTLEDLQTQGLFINICAWYWSRECKISTANLDKKFSNNSQELNNIYAANLIKTKSGYAVISFLDEQMKDRKKLAKRNRQNGLRGGRPKTQSVNSGLAKNNPKLTNIEEKRREEKIEEKNIKKSSTFTKPLVDEIRHYCKSRKNDVDPVKFYNFYESKGWMIGKSHMKNWMAAVHTWESNTKTKPSVKDVFKNGF